MFKWLINNRKSDGTNNNKRKHTDRNNNKKIEERGQGERQMRDSRERTCYIVSEALQPCGLSKRIQD